MWVAESYLFLLAGLPWLLGRERSAVVGWVQLGGWRTCNTSKPAELHALLMRGPQLAWERRSNAFSHSMEASPCRHLWKRAAVVVGTCLSCHDILRECKHGISPGRSFIKLHRQTLRWALTGPPSPTLCHHGRIQMLPANHTAMTNKAFARKQSPCTIRISFDQVPSKTPAACCAGTTWAC